MEYLRWILLAAGIFFILFVYLFGRKRRRQNDYDIVESQDDVPGFSAHDWDDLDEGVGEVRIIARDDSDEYLDEAAYDPESAADTAEDIDDARAEDNHADDSIAVEQPARQKEKQDTTDIIVLYIMARPEQKFAGDKINSAARANGLVFGDMNIFHRLGESGESVYALANMVEPGSFDPLHMHEMHTPGLTLFMQISVVVDPEAAFDDMLQCAYSMTEMLDGQLCNRRRQALTQSDAEQYRELVAGIDA